MAALRVSGRAEIAAIADPSPAVLSTALVAAPAAEPVASLEKLLDLELDGVVIATNGLAALQARVALEQGLAVFCQLPIGRSAKEVANVVEAAERSDRLLGLDRRYRFSSALTNAREVVANAEIGDVYAAMIELHTPDTRDMRAQLIDALAWVLRKERIRSARANGNDLRLDFTSGAVGEISISLIPRTEYPASISAELYGDGGARAFKSDAEPHGDPALMTWVEKLAESKRFRAEEVEDVVENASILDAVGSPVPLTSRKTAIA